MRGRTRLIATVVACLLLTGVACLGVFRTSTPTATADTKVVFNVALLQKPDSLNPYTGIAAESYELWYLIYPTLTTPAQTDLSSTPALAASWSHSADQLTWTFHLVKDAVWTDGVPVTSADVVFSLQSVVDGGTQAATWGSYLKGVTKVTAPDKHTVVLHLKKPNVGLPYLPMPIVPVHIWGKLAKGEVRSFKNSPPVVGAGPFTLVSADPTLSTITFERNPTYFGDPSKIDEIVFTVYKEEDAAVQALKKGEVDFVEGIQGLTVQRLQGAPGITTHIGLAPGFDEIAFNTGAVNPSTGVPKGDGNPAVQDPAFRHALGYAIDRREIISKVYQGLGSPGASVVPAGNPLQWQPPAARAFHFDLAKAGALLDAAGYTKGRDGKRHMPDGSPIGTLRLDARSDSPTSIGTMTYFKEWLGDLGIDATVNIMSGEKLTDIILQGDFDVFQWGWVADPDPDSVLSYMTCWQRGNWSDSWFCNKKYDAMYAAQHTQLDTAKRKVILDKMQRMLYFQAPYLVTTYGGTGEAYRSDRFTDFSAQPRPHGVYLMQFGPYNYVHVTPVAGGGTAELETQQAHDRTAFLVLLCGTLVVCLVASYVVSWQRALTADDRP